MGLDFAYEILRFVESGGNRRICGRFCGFGILQNYLFWLVGVGKVGRILLLAKAKSSKSFYFWCFALDFLTRFCEIAYPRTNCTTQGGRKSPVRNCIQIFTAFDRLQREIVGIIHKAKF